MQKSFKLQGAPLTSDQGLCPGPRWGLCPQTPVICSGYALTPDSDPGSALLTRKLSGSESYTSTLANWSTVQGPSFGFQGVARPTGSKVTFA